MKLGINLIALINEIKISGTPWINVASHFIGKEFVLCTKNNGRKIGKLTKPDSNIFYFLLSHEDILLMLDECEEAWEIIE